MFVNNKGKPYASLDTNRYWKFRLTGEYGLKASDNTINIFLRVLYIRINLAWSKQSNFSTDFDNKL